MAQGSRCRTMSRFQGGRGSNAIVTVTSSVTFLGGTWGVRRRWGGEGLKQEERCETAHRRELTGNVGLLGGQGAHLRGTVARAGVGAPTQKGAGLVSVPLAQS